MSNDIEVAADQWETDRAYWTKQADKRAKDTGILAVVMVENAVVYRAWPPRDSIFKGVADES